PSNKLRIRTKCHRGFAMHFRGGVAAVLFALFENAIVREVQRVQQRHQKGSIKFSEAAEPSSALCPAG
ncbi:MAG: hypothetical protein ABUJ93_12480, partial [Hyphomicrobium sp.]